MHHALSLHEIVQETLLFIDRNSDKLHFGLSCKSLWDVTKWELWRFADVKSLSCLLPLSLTCVDVNGPLGTELQLSRPVKDIHWQLIKSYTSHVRHLLLRDHNWDRIVQREAELFLCLVQMYNGEEPLFPCLKSLAVSVYSQNVTPALCRLVSVPLEHIKLSLCEDGPPSVIRFSLLIRAVGHPECLRYVCVETSLASDGADGTPTQAIGVLLGRLTIVRYIRLIVVDASPFLLPVSKLRLLERLDLNFRSCDLTTPYGLPVGDFPSLRALAIYSSADSFHHICLFLLQSIGSTSLAEFHYSFQDKSEYELHDILRFLATTWAATIIHVSVGSQSETPLVEKSGSFAAILPLTSCIHLQKLSLGFSRSYLQLSDQQLEIIASALPHLHILKVNTGFDMAWQLEEESLSPPLASRRSLRVIAARCPSIRFLSLSIDFDQGDYSDDSRVGLPFSSLCHLEAPYSNCSDPEGTVEFLRRTFPNLKAFLPGYDQDDGMQELQKLLGLPERDIGFDVQRLFYVTTGASAQRWVSE